MKTYDLENRLVEFAIAVIDISEGLPNSKTGAYLSNQLLRSGSSAALNYGEAQAAESRKDFIHKLRIILKELRETQINLKIIARRELISNESANLVQKECAELVAIFTASVATSKSKDRPS